VVKKSTSLSLEKRALLKVVILADVNVANEKWIKLSGQIAKRVGLSLSKNTMKITD
jgi:hypothetical protein